MTAPGLVPDPAPGPARASARVLGFGRVVGDLDRATSFYRDALGFRVLSDGTPADPALLHALGVDGAAAAIATIALGDDRVVLLAFARPGAAMPADSGSADRWFQHLAIVVDDMDTAWRRLRGAPGWRPISRGGPQTLPPRNGRVTACKVRDPDGHPLELIRFPPGQGRAIWHRAARRGAGSAPFLGIDHSAIAVGDGARSIAFYRRLGLDPVDRSHNHGPAQTRLDDVDRADVLVTGLRPADPRGPGLELLAYRPAGRPMPRRPATARFTDWTMLSSPATRPGTIRQVRDPDGHRVLLCGQGVSIGAPP